MPLLPPKQPAGNQREPNHSTQEGTVVFFEEDSKYLLGTVKGSAKGKLHILPMRGKELFLAAQRLYPLAITIPTASLSSESATRTFLEETLEKALDAAETISFDDMKHLWELLQLEAKTKEYNPGELSELYFLEPSTLNELVLLLRLTRDKIFFKRTRYNFTARSEDTVSELIKAEEARAKRQLIHREVLDYMHCLKKKEELPTLSSEGHTFLSELTLLAVGAPIFETGVSKEIRSFLDSAREEFSVTRGRSPSEKAYQLYRAARIFNEYTNTSVIRNEISQVEINQELTSEIEKISNKASSLQQERPISFFVTVDDESTRDRDDGLSLQIFNDNSYEVGIHIADVARFIEADSLFDTLSRKRASSVYIPEQTYHMLPQALSATLLSLNAGEPRAVVSLYLHVNNSGEILSQRFERETLTPQQNLTYDHVDELLKNGNDTHFLILKKFCDNHENARIEKGATSLPKIDMNLSVDSNNKVRISLVHEDSPARKLIAELMIIYNRYSAEQIASTGLPAIFRTQPPTQLSESDQESIANIPEGPARDFALRGTLQRSTQSLSPAPHTSLGLSHYTQISSPIRRYFDLLNQRQLLASLKLSEFQYTEQDFLALLPEVEEALARVSSTSKESFRFWLLHYFKQNVKGKSLLKGTVVRNEGRYPLVAIEEPPCILNYQSEQSPIALGTEVYIKAVNIVPEEGSIQLKVVEENEKP